MKIINELPKRSGHDLGITEKRVNEIKRFAKSGAKYAELDYRTQKQAITDTVKYKEALAIYKEQGGIGDLRIMTIRGKCYIERVIDND